MLFEDFSNKFGNFEIELVAPRQNKVDVDCAWKPVPYAVFIDAFSDSWAQFSCLCFSSFQRDMAMLGGNFHGRKRQEWC